MWNPPDQPNGIITGYEVMYSVYESATAPMMSERLNGSVESFLIENLGKDFGLKYDGLCSCLIHYRTWYTLSSQSGGIYHCW